MASNSELARSRIVCMVRRASEFNRPGTNDIRGWHTPQKGVWSNDSGRAPFRSVAELQVMKTLDAHPDVLAWGYEMFPVEREEDRRRMREAQARGRGVSAPRRSYCWPDFFIIRRSRRDVVLEVKGLPWLPDYALADYRTVKNVATLEDCEFHLFIPDISTIYDPINHAVLDDSEVFLIAAGWASILARECTCPAEQQRLSRSSDRLLRRSSPG